VSDAALERLAEAAGLSVHWRDYRDREQKVSPESLRLILSALELPAGSPQQIRDSQQRLEQEKDQATPALLVVEAGQPLHLPGRQPTSARLLLEDGSSEDLWLENDQGQTQLPAITTPGYHRLLIGEQCLRLAVTPRRSFGVADLGGSGRRWGLAAQLYSLRRDGDGGIGDFTALGQLVREAAQAGADAVAISPVHALFSADVSRFSPYAPSSRLFLNVLHVDPAAALGDAVQAQVAARLALDDELQRCRRCELIDWPAAAAARLKLLRGLYEEAVPRLDAADDPLGRSFRAFVSAGGAPLREHARFEALHAQQFGRDPQRWHWRSWPQELREPDSPAVEQFAQSYGREVGFHLFLQWLAAQELGGVQAQARRDGMQIGLIADLAIGTDSGGSHSWSRQHDMLAGLSVGAPPDVLNGHGQKWGLTAFSPRALRLHAYEPFLETLRASLRHAGGLRIDHVLGLRRLWLVPEDGDAQQGAYLSYPMHDLLRLLALESWRHRAIVIGEDLGTLPPGFRGDLAEAGILGIQLLWFERDHGYFIHPSRWSAQALATTTTHDLPTVAGWWQGRDIEWRARLGQLAPGADQAGETAERQRDRRTLWAAFEHAGAGAGPLPDAAGPVVDAALDFVACTPSPLTLVPLEDLLGLEQQPNLPGTTGDQHPNWQHRLPAPCSSLFEQAAVRQRLARLQAQRPRR
jgi:4-alpha-glucanotransferase